VKQKWLKYYFGMALAAKNASSATRDKVGCVLVKNNRVIASGFNGTVSSDSNVCEDPFNGLTLPTVVHAEINAIVSVGASTESTRNSVLFITRRPCIYCSAIILTAGIHEVHCLAKGNTDGIAYMQRLSANVMEYEIDEEHDNIIPLTLVNL